MNRITEGNRILAESLIRSVMKDYDAKGLAACIIDHDGNTQYEIFRGYRNEETKEEVNGDTIFGLASVTKSFTALAVMRLAEAGIISLDTPLSEYIPEFTNRNTDPVLVKHLLYHAGGFVPQPRIVVDQVAESLGLREETDGDLAYNLKLAEEGARLVAERLDSLSFTNRGLHGKPGEYMSYCNDGFGLLSEIIRRYGGYPSYAEYLNEEILKPLGMTRSFCDFVRPAQDENASVLYEKKDGVMHAHRNYHDNAFVLNGGGAMKSTLNDLKKYLCMYLNEGKSGNDRLLSASGIREMIRGRIPYTNHSRYCYGLYSSLLDRMEVIGHGGSLPGVSSNIAFTYDNDCAVIVLCNTSGVPVSVISDALIRMYAGTAPVIPRTVHEQDWPEELRRAAAGAYASGEGTAFEIIAKENGKLHVKDENGEKQLVMTGMKTAVVRNLYSDTELKPVFDRSDHLIGMMYGSRIIPRV